MKAGDLHQVSTIAVLLVGLPFLPCSGPPATMGVTEHPLPSLEGKKGGVYALGYQHPLPASPHPLFECQGSAGKLQRSSWAH